MHPPCRSGKARCLDWQAQVDIELVCGVLQAGLLVQVLIRTNVKPNFADELRRLVYVRNTSFPGLEAANASGEPD
jgi:hypothetical protein